MRSTRGDKGYEYWAQIPISLPNFVEIIENLSLEIERLRSEGRVERSFDTNN